MALIECPECKNSISTEAEICPNCGYPICKLKDKNSISRDSKRTLLLSRFLTSIKNLKTKNKIIIIATLVLIIALSVVLVHEYKLTPEEKAQVQSVYDQIEKIGKITHLQEHQILEPEKAFNSLTPRLQRRVSNRSILFSKKEQFDQLRADIVIKAISNLGNITLESKDDIEKIQQKYDTLSENQKSLVNNFDVYTNSINELNKLQIENTIDLIRKIGTVSLGNQEAIATARAAYDELGAEQKENIKNYDLLVSAETKLENLLVIELGEKIDKIGEITLESEDNIIELETLYKTLSSNSQKKVSNYSTLEAARAKLDELISQKKLEEKTTELRSIIRLSNLWFEVDSAGGVTVWINFTNNSDKVINYVTFTVTPYDTIGTELLSHGKYKATSNLVATGPYSKGEGLSGSYWRYTNVWYASTTSTIDCEKIYIEYSDGSTKTICRDDVDLVRY